MSMTNRPNRHALSRLSFVLWSLLAVLCPLTACARFRSTDGATLSHPEPSEGIHTRIDLGIADANSKPSVWRFGGAPTRHYCLAWQFADGQSLSVRNLRLVEGLRATVTVADSSGNEVRTQSQILSHMLETRGDDQWALVPMERVHLSSAFDYTVTISMHDSDRDAPSVRWMLVSFVETPAWP